MNLLTDAVNSFIAKAPPLAHDSLKAELDVLTGNYQHLCSRLNGKSKTLQVPVPNLLISVCHFIYTLGQKYLDHLDILVLGNIAHSFC